MAANEKKKEIEKRAATAALIPDWGIHNPRLNMVFDIAHVLTGGVAGCIAEIFSIPLDTLKVKSMTGQVKIPASVTSPTGKLLNVISVTYSKEGLRAFYGGKACISAAFQRQMVMASVKFGCYDNVKKRYCQFFDVSQNQLETPKFVKIMAASTTGIIGVLVGQPTDVVKVRTQAKLDSYKSTRQAYKDIYKHEGIRRGLWRGTLPGALRNMAVNSAEIGAYDIIKSFILRNKLMENNWPCFVFSSFCTGCIATAVSSPFDVMKTIYTNAKPGEYRNLLDCLVKTWSQGGIKSFYRGATFNGSRLVVWNIFMFFSLEELNLTLDKIREHCISNQ